jgi:hypothetical protein
MVIFWSLVERKFVNRTEHYSDFGFFLLILHNGPKFHIINAFNRSYFMLIILHAFMISHTNDTEGI